MNVEYEDSKLPELIAAALEIRDSGVEPQIEKLCVGSPHLVEAVKHSLLLSRQLPALQRFSAGRDRMQGATLASRYRLDSRIGSGAMGVVYKGWDEELSRPVAVKILNLPLGDEEEGEVRFGREAEALAAINHESVVRIYDRGRTAHDDPFLVMELVEGSSLSQLLVEVKGTPGSTNSKDTQAIAAALGAESIGERSYLRTAVRWMADVANGLALAHHKGIFHRDVKPSNILIDGAANPVIVDFGIAAQTSKETLTKAGDVIGTPAFMAPEAVREEVPASPALDIYGLTATLYELLTLRPPYSGTPTQVLSALCVGEPVSAGKLDDGIPRDLQAILECGMAREPGDRYASMTDLEEDLRAFLDYRPIQARRSTIFARAWRKVSRSTAWRTGAAVATIAIGMATGSELRSAWLLKQRIELREVWKHIPPNLGIAGPATRVHTLAEGRLETSDRLDRAVELSSHVFPATLVRAMFRVDHGQYPEALQDLDQIARAIDTPYTHALPKVFADWIDAGAVDNIDASLLPTAETPMDKYVAATLALRTRRMSEAVQLLSDPELSEYIPAQELATLLIADRAKQLERGIWIEERIGCRTANTANLIGIALLLKQDYEAALDAMRDGLELAPNSYPLHLNAARAAWMLGQIEDADGHYRQIIELRPDNAQGRELYIRFLTETGSTEQAQLALDAAAFETGDEWQALHHDLQGGIESEIALVRLTSGDSEAARDAAMRAQEQFTLASDLGRTIDSTYSRFSRAILDMESSPHFWALLDSVTKNPWHARRIQLLEAAFPTELDESQTTHVRRLLTSFRSAFVSRGLTEEIHSAVTAADSSLASNHHPTSHE